MTSSEVVMELRKRGIEILPQTLLRYEAAGVIPSPERKGIYGGLLPEYPYETIELIEKAYYAFHPDVKYWRDRALKAEGRLLKLKIGSD